MNKTLLVIFCYNEEKNIKPLLTKIKKYRVYKNRDILFIDDCSKDSTNQIIKFNKIKNSRIYRNKKNIGFSAGYNQGVKLCETDFSLILGPDCIIETRSIIKLYEKLRLNENCFLTASTSYNENNQLTYAGGLLPENGEKDFPIKLEGDICVENTLGACMFFKTK